jgi:putative cardiolipin synthase
MLGRRSQLFLLIMIVMIIVSSCATLPDDFERPASYAFSDTEDTRLAKIRSNDMVAHPGQSGFLLLGNGLDAFVARAMLAESAECSIDAQYYLYHNDLVAKLFTDLLLRAADRGVRVRLLVDDMAMGGRDLDAAVLACHPNIEVRLFNPFTRNTSRTMQFLTRYGFVTRRMHNKSFTVDNQATILGGRNIGDEYFDAHPDLAFSDMDVLAIGPVVLEVSSVFDLYWNSDFSYPALVLKGKPPSPEEIDEKTRALKAFIASQQDSPYLEALRNSNLAKRMGSNQVNFAWGKGVVVYDLPEKLLHDKSRTEFHLYPQLERYLNQIEDELIIFSPYFVPGKKGAASLIAYRERGVRVRILTNSLASNDVAIVHSGYSKYRKDLLRAGIELYELNRKMSRQEKKEKKGEHAASKASLHAKSFVFDRKRLFIGSMNLDPAAVYNNTEIGMVITQKEIANGMGEWFDQNIDKIAFRLELMTDDTGYERILWHGQEKGEAVTYKKEPHTSFWTRFGIGFMKILPIEPFL